MELNWKIYYFRLSWKIYYLDLLITFNYSVKSISQLKSGIHKDVLGPWIG